MKGSTDQAAPAIEVRDLGMNFGSFRAVAGVSSVTYDWSMMSSS